MRTGRHTILIDACIGNDKERPTRPQFHRMRTSFIDDLARARGRAEEVDYVMCTHLHWDHVGWNTRLVDGRWVPTFPTPSTSWRSANTIIGRISTPAASTSPHARAFEDSILPVVKTGQAMLVGDDYALEDGLWFESRPGHTPGNVVIHAEFGRASAAVFIGDVLHHPLQCLKPEWSTCACTDMDLSREDPHPLIEEHEADRTLVLPAHFPDPDRRAHPPPRQRLPVRFHRITAAGQVRRAGAGAACQPVRRRDTACR